MTAYKNRYPITSQYRVIVVEFHVEPAGFVYSRSALEAAYEIK